MTMVHGTQNGRMAVRPGTATRRCLMANTAPMVGGAAVLLAAACGLSGAEKPSVTQQPKTIVFDSDWATGPLGSIMDQSLQEWSRRYPTIKIDRRDVLTQAGTIFEKTAALMAADSLGDVMLWAGYIFTYWAKRGVFVDVGPYLKKHRINLEERFYIPEHIIYEGKVYGFPFQYGPWDWMYNKSLFKRVGIKEPDETWTWDTAFEAARRLTSPQDNVYGFAYPRGFFQSFFEYLHWEMGGEERSKDDKKTLFDTPVALEALTYVADLVNRYRVAPTQRDNTALKLTIPQGSYAMWMYTPKSWIR